MLNFKLYDIFIDHVVGALTMGEERTAAISLINSHTTRIFYALAVSNTKPSQCRCVYTVAKIVSNAPITTDRYKYY
jgi:hypothetical protein